MGFYSDYGGYKEYGKIKDKPISEPNENLTKEKSTLLSNL